MITAPATQLGTVTVGRRELIEAFARRTKLRRAPRHVPATGLRAAALIPALGGFRVEMPGGAHFVWALEGALTDEIVFDPTRIEWCMKVLELQEAAQIVQLRVYDLILELKCGSATVKLPLKQAPKPGVAYRPRPLKAKAGEKAKSSETDNSNVQRKGHKEILLEVADDLDELFQAAQEAEDDPVWLKLINSATAVTKMAPYNMMLAKIQRPGATFVGFRDDWASIGRTVKPGAIPILVLWPFGPVRCAYDLSDTTGTEIEDKALAELFGAPQSVPENAYARLCRAAKKADDIDVSEQKIAGTMAGRAMYFPIQNAKGHIVSRTWSVQVSQTLHEAGKLATLIHELAHIYLGHLGGSAMKWPDRQKVTQDVKEFEAEAVCYIIGKRLGFTTGSAEYLKDYIDEHTLKKISPSTIARVAGRIENSMLR